MRNTRVYAKAELPNPRGGSAIGISALARSAARTYFPEDTCDRDIGFRPILVLEVPECIL
jgi:hypothetical protein